MDFKGEEIVIEINKSSKEDNKPALLILHALGGKKENSTIHKLAKTAPEYGFNTIQFDFTGHGESEGKLEECTVTKQVQETEKVIECLRNNYDFLGNSLILVGNSFSVITSLELGDRDVFQSLVLIGGRANYLDWIDTLDVKDGKYYLYPGAFVDEGFLEDYRKYDPLENISKINKPILVIHGGEDDVISPSDAELFHKEAKNSELHFIEGVGHQFTGKKDLVVKKTLEFLGKTL